MKTIKQVADEIGVSTQAIYKKINKTLKSELNAHVKLVQGQRLIDEQGEIIIKNSLQPVANQQEQLQTDGEQNIYKVANNAVAHSLQPVANQQEQLQTDGENEQLKEYVEFLKAQLEKVQDELSKEREHSRLQVEGLQNKIINQSDRIADLAEKLAELTRNSQILHKQEQDKNALSSPEQSTTVSSEPDADGTKLKQRPFWQFWKK